MLTQDKSIGYDTLLADKHSTRMELADALLPDLLKAAAGSRDAEIAAAAAVLRTWDHDTNIDSRGAVLFESLVNDYFAGVPIDSLLRVKWDPAAPLTSAYGLENPEGASSRREREL